jgi:hypothetical protein
MERDKLQRLIAVATFIAGVAAAYLMRRRGEPLLKIAKKAITNPVGSLATEVQNVWSESGGEQAPVTGNRS